MENDFKHGCNSRMKGWRCYREGKGMTNNAKDGRIKSGKGGNGVRGTVATSQSVIVQRFLSLRRM